MRPIALCRERADEFDDRLIELRPWTRRQEYALCGTGADTRPTSALGIDRSGPSLEIASRQGEAGSPRRRGRTPRCENRGARFRGWRRQRQGRRRSPVRPRSRLGRSQGGAGCKDGRRVRDRDAETRSDHGAAFQSYRGRRGVKQCTAGAAAEVRSALEQTRRQLQDSLRKRAAIAEEIEKALRAIGHGLDIDIGLAGLNLWRSEARPGDRGPRKTDWRPNENVVKRRSKRTSSRERIAKAMRSAGVDISQDDDVAAMLAAGQAALDRAVDAKDLRAAIEDRRRDLRFREKKLGDARLAEEAWSKDWRRACATCWLGEREILPTTAVVRETLEALAELGLGLGKTAELTDRIAKMQRDQDPVPDRSRRARRARSGCHRARTLSDFARPSWTASRRNAKTIDRRLEVEARLAIEQDKARALADETAEVQAQASLMMNHFGAGSLTEVDGRLRALARRSDLEARSNPGPRRIARRDPGRDRRAGRKHPRRHRSRVAGSRADRPENAVRRRGPSRPRPILRPQQGGGQDSRRRRRRCRRDPGCETADRTAHHRRQGIGVSQAEARDGGGRQSIARLIATVIEVR